MLKIWGRNNSVNVQKVLWCCEEMGVKYERIDAGGQFGVVNTPQYRALNPNGLVPTVEDGPFVLWESNSIVRYLAAKHSAGKLWPEDLKTRAVADKWMDFMITTFWPAFRPLFWNLVRTPIDQRNPQAMEESRLQTAEVARLPRCASEESHLHRRRRPDHGRHPHGLRGVALVRAAVRTAGAAQPAALVRQPEAAARLSERRAVAADLSAASRPARGAAKRVRAVVTLPGRRSQAWLAVGWFGVGLVIYLSLTPTPPRGGPWGIHRQMGALERVCVADVVVLPAADVRVCAGT